MIYRYAITSLPSAILFCFILAFGILLAHKMNVQPPYRVNDDNNKLSGVIVGIEATIDTGIEHVGGASSSLAEPTSNADTGMETIANFAVAASTVVAPDASIRQISSKEMSKEDEKNTLNVSMRVRGFVRFGQHYKSQTVLALGL